MLPDSIQTANAFADEWARTMWAVVWQSTLLVLVAAALGGLLLRRASPDVRFWLWQILALKLLAMPFWSWAVPLPFPTLWEDAAAPVAIGPAPEAPVEALVPPSERDVSHDGRPEEIAGVPAAAASETDSPGELSGPGSELPAGESPHPAAHAIRPRWTVWLMAAWAAIVLAHAGRIVLQRRRLGALLQRCWPANEEIVRQVAEAAARIGLAPVPRVMIGPAGTSPFVCGIWRPTLVVPQDTAGSPGSSPLEPVLLHELAHVKRRDLLWGWIPELARIAYFFHPVAHWIGYRARLERELACDRAAMLHSGQSASEYAATLVRIVGQSVQAAAATAGLDGGGGSAECGMRNAE